jgi:hypothetical protein
VLSYWGIAVSEFSGVFDFYKDGVAKIVSTPRELVPQSVKNLHSDFYTIPVKGFVQFNSLNYDEDAVSKNGWKLHMSVSQEHTGKALEIMLDEFKKSGHTGGVKVATEKNLQRFSDPSDPQAGKILTLYDDGRDPELTKKLMIRLEERFRQEGIKPGPTVSGDRPVSGSQYSSYRNDRTLNGNYSADKSDYNVSKRPDPFQNLDVSPTIKPNAPETLRPNTPKVDAATLYVAQMTVAAATYEETINKGNRLKSPNPDDLRAALKTLGFKPGEHFNETKSLTTGQTVFQLTSGGDAAFKEQRTGFQAGKPPVMVGETPQAGKPTASPAEPARPVQAQAVRPAPVDLALDFGESAKPPAAAQPARPAVAATVDIPLDVGPAQQAARPQQQASTPPARAPAPLDLDLSGDSSPTKTSASPPRVSSSFVGTGQRVEGRLGVAQTALTAGAQAAQGDYSGAAVTVGSAAAQQAGLGKAAQLAEKAAEKAVPVVMAVAEKLGVAGAAKTGGKFVPGLGGVIGAVETAVNVTSALRQGQYAKAGVELVSGTLSTIAGTVGFGMKDHVQNVFHQLVKHTVGEKYAPEQSQLYAAVGAGIDAGKAALNKPSTNDPAKMSRSELAAAIQRDPDLPDTVPFKGGRAELATALQDKGFRERYLRQLEDENKMGVKRNQEIALIKAYEKSLESPSAPAAQAAISQNANRPASPVAPASSPQAQAQLATLNAQYRSMSTTQLSREILNDPVLPNTVPWKDGKTISIQEAIKDNNFRDDLINRLEKMQAQGQDYTTQIAMLKAYDGKMDASNPVNPATQMAQSQMQRPVSTPPPSITAPMA